VKPPALTIRFDWHGIPVSVVACPDWSEAYKAVQGQALSHLSIYRDGGGPLPISETGFRSAFIASAVIEGWGGPEAYVRGWLDAFANDPAWIEARDGVQLTLF
jgi:hypothetical protein